MKREVDLKEISDGKLYTAGDMVRADTGGCRGCSACCCGMGESIILDPLDGWRLCRELSCSFEELLSDRVELNVVDGIVLPNLRMEGPGEACSFLDPAGRCSIHRARPGICRLFPMGRYYEGRDFRYFLQTGECSRPRSKIKLKKWLDTPELARYEAYIRDWHYYLEDVGRILDQGSDQMRSRVCTWLIRWFYLTSWDMDRDFYPQFEERLAEGRRHVGIAAG